MTHAVFLRIAIGLCLFWLGCAADARAQEAEPEPVPWRNPERLQLHLGEERAASAPGSASRKWYGWQTLTADGLSIAATYALALAFNGGPIGLLGLLLASPIVHFAHGNTGAGFISLGIRATSLLLATLGVLVAVPEILGADGRSSHLSALPWVLLLAGFGGMVAAILTDAIALAYDKPRAAGGADARLVPFADPRTGSAGLAWVGTL